MQSWLNFWIVIFWLSFFSFLINHNTFMNLLIFSELAWVVLYCYSMLTGTLLDDLNSFTLSFFMLGLASVEFCVGFLLIVLFKTMNKSMNLIEDDKYWNNYFYKFSKRVTNVNNVWNMM